MEGRSRVDYYQEFVTFIKEESRRQRSAIHRRMFSVLLWCFLAPVMSVVAVLFLIHMEFLPRDLRGYVDWLILIFPVSYSIYFLTSEIGGEVPVVFRKGGLAASLNHTMNDARWRNSTCDDLQQKVGASPEEWGWIVTNFKMDLRRMRHRSRYFIALGGAVFFFIMQGLDILNQPAIDSFDLTPQGFVIWIMSAFNNLSQLVGLGLFLLLLHLSASQNHHFLERYLQCAELLRDHPVGRRPSGSQKPARVLTG